MSTHFANLSEQYMHLVNSPCNLREIEKDKKPLRKQRRKMEDHIRRPRNAWIIFRNEVHEELKESSFWSGGISFASKYASDKWKNLPTDIKSHYEQLAAEEKEQHKIKYPDYKFKPRKSVGGNNKKTRQRLDKDVSSSTDFNVPSSFAMAKDINMSDYTYHQINHQNTVFNNDSNNGYDVPYASFHDDCSKFEQRHCILIDTSDYNTLPTYHF